MLTAMTTTMYDDPANWKDILETIECLKGEGIKFIINTVVSNLNIMCLDKLLMWVQKNNYLNYLYILESPDHYKPVNLPNGCLKIAINRLSKLPRDFKNQNTIGSVDNLIDMCNNVVVSNKKDNLLWNSFIKEVKMRDTQRGNCIVDVIARYLNNFLIKYLDRGLWDNLKESLEHTQQAEIPI